MSLKQCGSCDQSVVVDAGLAIQSFFVVGLLLLCAALWSRPALCDEQGKNNALVTTPLLPHAELPTVNPEQGAAAKPNSLPSWRPRYKFPPTALRSELFPTEASRAWQQVGNSTPLAAQHALADLALPPELTEPQEGTRGDKEVDFLDILPDSLLDRQSAAAGRSRSDLGLDDQLPPPLARAPEKAPEVSAPTFYLPPSPSKPLVMDRGALPVPYEPEAFSPGPQPSEPSDPQSELSVYRGKFEVPVQRPWVELWRPLYSSGIYPPAIEWFGRYNPVMPHFLVYGDYRSGLASNRNINGPADVWAHRLNLDMDLEITATERIHAFMGPLDRNGDFTHLDLRNRLDFVNRADLRLDTLYFEGDVGAMYGGLSDQDAPFDLPIAFGFMPLFYQNGIWANDNVIGAAAAIPSRNSPWLRWSNFDATFFWASDQVTSDAFPSDNNAAEFFGTAWFIDAYDGFIEADYAFVHDDAGQHRSYHNLSLAFTRRYLQRFSNSVRFITNFDQSLPPDQRTADGHLFLIENSLITAYPNTFVPYFNLFHGQGRTQSLARAGVAGGILNNTGINFETDGLTGYPTLDATGVNTTGAALGVNLLGANFSHQLVIELAALTANGSAQFRYAAGDQYALGLRYQKPLNNAWIFRTDHMYGWLREADDLRGSRMELRWKF